MADRTSGGKEVDARSQRLARDRIRLERMRLEVQATEAAINIEEMIDAIERRKEQIVKTVARIEELRTKEKELEDSDG